MTMYILSIFITLLANFLTNRLINNELVSMGYVVKSKRNSKISFGISFSLNFIPYLNLIISILSTILCCASLCNEKLLLEITRERRHDPDDVISEYKRSGIKKDVLKDVMVLDGANKKEIKEELKKVDNYTNFASKEKSWFGITLDDTPIYNEKDYNNALALKLAKEFIFEIENSKELSKKQKRELLSLCKKDFLDEIKGKDNNKSDSKILKLVNEDVN